MFLSPQVWSYLVAVSISTPTGLDSCLSPDSHKCERRRGVGRGMAHVEGLTSHGGLNTGQLYQVFDF